MNKTLFVVICAVALVSNAVLFATDSVPRIVDWLSPEPPQETPPAGTLKADPPMPSLAGMIADAQNGTAAERLDVMEAACPYPVEEIRAAIIEAMGDRDEPEVVDMLLKGIVSYCLLNGLGVVPEEPQPQNPEVGV